MVSGLRIGKFQAIEQNQGLFKCATSDPNIRLDTYWPSLSDIHSRDIAQDLRNTLNREILYFKVGHYPNISRCFPEGYVNPVSLNNYIIKFNDPGGINLCKNGSTYSKREKYDQ